MRLVFVAIVAALMGATPAFADDTQFEAHTGGAWLDGRANLTFGLGAIHDWTLVPGTFAGVEASVDKILGSDSPTSFSAGGRAGFVVPVLGRIYGVAGYSTKPYYADSGQWDTGIGIQKSIEPGAYAKLEYRHYFSEGNTGARNNLLFGVGASF